MFKKSYLKFFEKKIKFFEILELFAVNFSLYWYLNHENLIKTYRDFERQSLNNLQPKSSGKLFRGCQHCNQCCQVLSPHAFSCELESMTAVSFLYPLPLIHIKLNKVRKLTKCFFF